MGARQILAPDTYLSSYNTCSLLY